MKSFLTQFAIAVLVVAPVAADDIDVASLFTSDDTTTATTGSFDDVIEAAVDSPSLLEVESDSIALMAYEAPHQPIALTAGIVQDLQPTQRERRIELQWLYLQPRTTFGEISTVFSSFGTRREVVHEPTFDSDTGLKVQVNRPLENSGNSYTITGTTFGTESSEGFFSAERFFVGQRLGLIDVVSRSFSNTQVDFTLEFLYHDLEATLDHQFDWSPTTTLTLSGGIRGSLIEQQRAIRITSPILGSFNQVGHSSKFLGIGPTIRATLQKTVGESCAVFVTPAVSLLAGKHDYDEFILFPGNDRFYDSDEAQLVPVVEFNGGVSKSWDTQTCRVTLTGGYQVASFLGLKTAPIDRSTLATHTSLMGGFVGLAFSK